MPSNKKGKQGKNSNRRQKPSTAHKIVLAVESDFRKLVKGLAGF